ncbi:MAG: RNA-binding transcriptional accessory protein [Firmicutes bacterium]|nr:RNA-binding transcriptional accessory protein [Bacillota bacterium]
MNIIEKLAAEFHLKQSQVEATVNLIDEGNTIPFIARYRKEVTGALSDVVLRDLDERLTYLRNLDERKEEVIRLISEQGKLTEELEAEIRKAEVLQRVEDLYKPFKQKKATRASKAREKGLEPLAKIMMAQEEKEQAPEEVAASFVNEEKGVKNTKEALQGAMDIIAEIIADDADYTARLRELTFDGGMFECEAVDPDESTVYDMYYGKVEAIKTVPNHRVLAMNRGEKEKKLKIKVKAPVERIHQYLGEEIIGLKSSVFTSLLEATIEDAYKRLMAPSIEREIRNQLTERAEVEAVKVFAKNTEALLMVPPVKDARVIAIDPGYRTGCKVTMLDETGKLLAYGTIYPTEPKKDIAGAKKSLTALVKKYKANVFVIGNGTASRETESFVAELISDLKEQGIADNLHYTIVNEAGASIYSASKLATEEYPDLDVTTRGAMSIGRRLQDPLAELVKIDPKHIGVGQYQHDINQTLLTTALTNVVEDCVNRVGVDLNTASASLLAYISGINSGIAKNIVAYREEHGRFNSRKELLKVAKLGEKTYNQCAGFLRISDGKEPLDATSVHPESYKAAEQMLEKLGIDKSEITRGGYRDIDQKILTVYPVKLESDKKAQKSSAKNDAVGAGAFAAAAANMNGGRGKGLGALAVLKAQQEEEARKKKEEQRRKAKKEQEKKGPSQEELLRLKKSVETMADDLGIGAITLSDIVSEIKKPARDPREGMPPVVFRSDVLTIDDLKVGMEMTGTVRNVVDFGAFVDIGVKNDGLVHISEISNKFIKHPMDAVSVGDTVKVKILGVDYAKGKVSLTMKL